LKFFLKKLLLFQSFLLVYFVKFLEFLLNFGEFVLTVQEKRKSLIFKIFVPFELEKIQQIFVNHFPNNVLLTKCFVFFFSVNQKHLIFVRQFNLIQQNTLFYIRKIERLSNNGNLLLNLFIYGYFNCVFGCCVTINYLIIFFLNFFSFLFI
jgi:hypothetical protein